MLQHLLKMATSKNSWSQKQAGLCFLQFALAYMHAPAELPAYTFKDFQVGTLFISVFNMLSSYNQYCWSDGQ